MKVFACLFLLFLSSYCFSQNPLNASYKRLKDGEYIDKFSNNRIRTKWTIKNRNIEGEHLNYFRNGNLKSKENFNNGMFNGSNYRLKKNGDTLIVEKYKNDTILYFRKLKYYRTGELKSVYEINFTDSLQVNPFSNAKKGIFNISYDIDEVISLNYNNGTYTHFYKSGSIKSIYYGIKGKLNGEGKKYYKNGNIKVIAQFQNNKLCGEYLVYNKIGEIIKVLKYKEGKKLKNNRQ